MVTRTSYLQVLFAMVLLVVVQAGHTANIETLLMPGQLIEGHAKYEEECTKCHVRFSKGTQTRLCRDCHEAVDKDISRSEGFHGRKSDIRDAQCRSCHTDHIGRSADIVLLNRATFDHRNTDFALKGKHRETSCNNCHKPDKAFADTGSACIDCHEAQEPHRGNLGNECDTCHTEEAWERFEYDHDQTDFPLQGKHEEVACGSCHANERYKDIPGQCISCHALDDAHDGRNGKKCQECHTPAEWQKTDFDHDKKTDFRLRGRHRHISCNACHTEALGKEKPAKDCHSCHRRDDQHHGRYGKKCQSCHNEDRWQEATFDHDKNTKFSLRGKHKELTCTSCHRGNIYEEKLSVTCGDCHQADNVHRGQQGNQCGRCHRETGWTDEVLFDHDLTSFPLIGMHASTPCEECHFSTSYKDTLDECVACHRGDDEHKASLGPNCGSCHNPNSWALWIFDHNDTDFPLDGAHQELSCNQCHKKTVKDSIQQSSRCNACHQQDDIHGGDFGKYCERCHSTGAFEDVTIGTYYEP